MSDDDQPAWRQQLEQSLQELKSLGEQVGQKVGDLANDAEGEAKGAWEKMKPHVGEAEAKVRETTADAVAQLEGMFSEIRDSLRSLRDKL